MNTYAIHTSLAGAFLPNTSDEFDASEEFAIAALVDEAAFQLDAEDSDDDEYGDLALVESLRGSEGRADLAFKLRTYGEVGIVLDSPCNGFGIHVTLVRVDGAA